MLAVLSSKLHSTGKSRNDMETAKWYIVGHITYSVENLMQFFSVLRLVSFVVT